MVGYLDQGQETIKYPDRLATQLRNSHEISNRLDGDGLGWMEGPRLQMSQYVQTQVDEILTKNNLQPGHTVKYAKATQQPRRVAKRPEVFGLSSDVDDEMDKQGEDAVQQKTLFEN